MRVEELAAQWDVSPTPLREAVRTLAGEGLIVLQPQRGARVAEVSAAEMHDVYATRILLEPMRAPALARAGGRRLAGSSRSAPGTSSSARTRRPRTPLDLEPAHADFHQALLAACGSPSLLRICAQLATQSLRFRVLTGSRARAVSPQSRGEHRALYAGRARRATSRRAVARRGSPRPHRAELARRRRRSRR